MADTQREKTISQMDRLRKRWIANPADWVADNFPTVTLSTQQRKFFEMLGTYINAKLKVGNGEDVTEEERDLAKKLGFSISAGQGCHALGQGVLMFDGTIKRVEDVVVGEALMGDDSSPRFVTHLVRGREQMYRISYRGDDNYYDVNESHILSLRASDTHGSYNRGDIFNIPLKDYLGWSDRKKSHILGYKTGVEFPANDTRLVIPPYILGIWLGDGCFSAPELTTIDPELIEAWREWGESLGLSLKKRSYKSWRICNASKGSRSNAWMELLKSEGLYRNKHIPHKYLVSSRSDRLQLLAGLIDTDGDTSVRRGRIVAYNITCKSDDFAHQIQFLARSLGYAANIRTMYKSWTHNGTRKTGTYYQIRISRNGLGDIPIRIKRKQYGDADHFYMDLNFGLEVRPIGEDDYYGFQVTGNRLYVLEDFTVTHNCGKDFMSAMVIFYILWVAPRTRNTLKHDRPRCIATGVNAKHLRNVLWAELSKIMLLSKSVDNGKTSNTILSELFEWRTDRLEYKGDAKNWFAESATINKNASADEQAATLYGRHASTMLIIADEAADIPDCVFETMEGTMTGDLNFALMIFNPIKTSGYALRSQTSGDYIALRWDAEESELVSRESIEQKRKYGEDSFEWRVRVKGLPPLVAQNSLIPTDWVLRAMEKSVPDEAFGHLPVKVGADVGGGGDKSVCCVKQGPKVVGFAYNGSPDTLVITDWVASEYRKNDADCVIPDVVGIGHGVYYGLKQKKNIVTRKGDAREQARNPDKFYNRRAEAGWAMREDFEADLIDLSAVKDTPGLIDQFGAIMYDPANKSKLGSKKDIRKLLGGSSPDEFDSLLLTYYVSDDSLEVGMGQGFAVPVDYTQLGRAI